MTKKLITVLLISLMVFAMAACSPKNSSNVKYEGTLEDLMTAIYEKRPVELMLSPTSPVDLTNSETSKYYIGLSDTADIKEAVYSETMIGSQAYSLCLIRVKDGADIETVKQNVLDGVDPRKWICVGTDKVVVTNYGDVIAMIMVDDNLSENMSEELYNAFSDAVGGELGKKLERTAE